MHNRDRILLEPSVAGGPVSLSVSLIINYVVVEDDQTKVQRTTHYAWPWVCNVNLCLSVEPAARPLTTDVNLIPPLGQEVAWGPLLVCM
jgi:hypothetical protein